eukprot:2800116-Prymnesium_polylepis.1
MGVATVPANRSSSRGIGRWRMLEDVGRCWRMLEERRLCTCTCVCAGALGLAWGRGADLHTCSGQRTVKWS